MSRATGPRVIKKYGNRRLYDTVESRYVTLEELAAVVRGGADVRVVDDQSGADLTQAVLLQIIIEGRGAAQFFSVPILTQLVRMSDDALGDFLGRWLSAAMEIYQQARSGLSAITPFNPLSVPYAAGNLIARVLNAVPSPWMAPQPPPSFTAAYAEPAAPEAPPEAPAAPAPEADSLDALRRELEAIKRSLRGDATSPSPQRNNTRSTEKKSVSRTKKAAARRADRG